MIRFVLRFLGLWILAAAFIFFIYDGAKSIADSTVKFTSAGQIWHDINSTSLQLFQAGVERHVAEWLWQSIIQPILEQPFSLVLAVVGIVLVLLGRKKKPLIGYGRD
jgi:hypothetical protein